MASPFLPTSKKEVEALGWDRLDVILFMGDAYVDHPSFGVSVIARVLEAKGYKVAVVPQPNWRDDLQTGPSPSFLRRGGRCDGLHGQPLHCRQAAPQQ